MQFVNNDMDELMRRAAENYPLDTSTADWSKIQAALKEEESPKAPVVEKKPRNRGRLLWLLLLLPLAFVCNRYWMGGDGNGVAEFQKSRELNEAADRQNKNSVNNDYKAGNSINKADATHSGQENKELSGLEKASGGSPLQQRGVSEKQAGIRVQANAGAAINQPRVNEKNSSLQKVESVSHTGYTANDGKRLVAQNRQKKIARHEAVEADSQSEANVVQGNFNNELQPDNRIRLERTRAELVRGFKHSGKAEFREVPVNPLLADRKPVKVPQPVPEKRFYAGLLLGMDATSIKFQKVEGTGYQYGALLGYRLGSRWSVEAGALYEKKTYYSEGKHVDKSRIYIPPNTTVTDVSGICYMWEIPLSMRYELSVNARRSWFLNGGLTSYIMQKEDYDFVYLYASGTSYVHSYSYSNTSTHLMAAFHISGGFNRKFGNYTNLRVEPYLKIPVKGLGTGKLPMMSTGIQVGVTRDLF